MRALSQFELVLIFFALRKVYRVDVHHQGIHLQDGFDLTDCDSDIHEIVGDFL